MAINKASSRQSVAYAEVVVNFGDPTTYGTAEDAIEVPPGARVIGGDATIITPFNSTTNTLVVGDVTSAARYGTGIDLKAAAGTRTALTLTGFTTTTTERFIRANLAQTGGAPTAGSVRISVQYVKSGRSNFNQG